MKFLLPDAEGKNCAFKRDFTPTAGIINTCAAFVNTSGGSIFIGVADDGDIVGIGDDDLNLFLEGFYAEVNLEKPNELISIFVITNHTLKFFDFLVSIWRSVAQVFQHDLGQMASKESKDKDLALENLLVNKWLTCLRSKKESVIN